MEHNINDMKTFEEKQHTQLVRKFHAIMASAGIDADGKSEILEAYGVTSSKDLSCGALIEICNKIDTMQSSRKQDLDHLRKMVFASVGNYLKMAGRESNASIIKGIVCRITKYGDFNRIPSERLRNVYNLFLDKQRDYTAADEMIATILNNVFPNNQIN